MVNVIQGGPMPIVSASQEAATLRAPVDPHKEVHSSEKTKRNGHYNGKRDGELQKTEKGKRVNLQV